MKRFFIIAIACLGFFYSKTHAQCGAGTPTFIVDLSTNPNGTWISPDTVRNDTCCGATAPDKCIEFIVTLHPLAEGIIFNIHSGAVPPGALFYQVACGPIVPVGDPLCLNGPGPHSITFCKPGNNNNEYSILSVAEPGIGPDIAVNDGCNGQIFAFGYDPASIVWTSINPGPPGTYDSYLDCTLGCDSVNVNALPGFPPFVDYQVCGFPLGGCDTVGTCDTVRAYFNSTLTATILPQNPTICFGNPGTTITANGGGGTPPYNYLWSTGDTTQSIFVGVGTYYVTLGDSSGCPPTTDTVVVTAFALPISADAGVDQTVCDDNMPINLNGTVVAATGGIWSGGNGTYSPSDSVLTTSYTPTPLEIASGSVTLYLTTTGNGTCPPDIDTVVISITKFNAVINVATDSVNCFGGSDGSGIISFSGGVPPFTTSWNTTPIQVGDTATGLAAGSYNVTLTDGNGCDTVIVVDIFEPTPLNALISDSIDISCTGGNDGGATVSASGGTGPYSFLWDANTGNQTDSNATGLFAGTYGVLVTDNNGCTDSTTVTLTEPAAAITLTLSTTDVTCYGDTNGTATAVPSGGTPPYSFLWTANAGSQTTGTAINLAPGSYGVTVTDTNGCIYQPGIIIGEPLPLSSSTSFTAVNCFGGADGTATVVPSGGIAPYTYLWDANAGNQTTSTATNLIAGSYNVTITDTNGCFFDTLVTVTQPLSALNLSLTTIDVDCFGNNSGSATVTVLGGTPGYNIQWDAGTGSQTGVTASNLMAGNYTVIVTDTNGCQDSLIATINQPAAPLTTPTTFTAVSCNGGSDGTATVSPAGGTTPYSYLWDASTGNQTNSTATGLIAGNYSVIVTDTNGCLDTAVVIVTEPNLMTITATVDDTICPLANTTIGVNVNGGNGGFVYNWNMGLSNNSTHIVNPTTTTTYTVSVTDSLGCTGNMDSLTVYVLNLYPDSMTVISAGDICTGSTTQITGNYTAGFGTYTYSWNQGLGSGLGPFNVSPTNTTTYILTVTDQCNNSISDSVVVNVFPYPVIDLAAIIAQGCEPLTVVFTDTINNPATVSYDWDFGDGTTSNQASPIHTYNSAGTYTVNVTITSNGGCVSTSSGNNVVIVNPTPLASFTANPQITDIDNPLITFTNLSSGAIGFSWDFGDGDSSTIVNPIHTYQDTGSYIVTLSVINQFGCTNTYQVPIEVGPAYSFDIPNAFTPNTSGGSGGAYDATSLLNDVFYPTTEYVKDFHMMIFNRWGEMVFESFDIKIGWDGYYRGVIAQQDVYVWKIDITYTDHKKLSKTGDLTLIR